MARIPIFQMCYGCNPQFEDGLVFPTELPEYSIQSIIFTIPIPRQYDSMDILDYLKINTFYFPFSFDDKYMELEAKVNFTEMTFEVPNTDYRIAFDTDTDNFYRWHPLSFRYRHFRLPKYIGDNKELVKEGDWYLSLLPTSLLELNELYLNHKGVFVGLTPSFGERNNSSDQREILA